MGTIRRLNCFDRHRIKEMISYLGTKDDFSGEIMRETFIMLQSFFPLKYKFLPESFILLDENEIQGLITIVPAYGNPYKISITRLIFKQNNYDAGKRLTEFVIAKYGAKGAVSFNVLVDDSHEELFDLFVSGCGFRQCSSESLWKLTDTKAITVHNKLFRCCQKNDAEGAALLFNNEIISLYHPSLDRTKEEYQDPFFAGFSGSYKNRYVAENSNGEIIGYISVTTQDNFNFIIDLSLNSGYEINYGDVIDFALSEISRRKNSFCVFVKQKRYTQNADKLEEYLKSKNAELVQTQRVLVKDFYRPVKQNEPVLQVNNGIVWLNR